MTNENKINYYLIPERESDQDPKIQPVLDKLGSDLFVHSPLGMIFIDSSVRNIYINPTFKQLFKLSTATTESSLSHFLSVAVLSRKNEAINPVLISKLLCDKLQSYPSIEYNTLTGTKHFLDIKTIPNFSFTDEMIGTLVIIKDLTAEKNLESQILRLQKSENTGELFGGIIHNHRNLLTIISGNLELALTHDIRDSSLKSQLQTVLSVTRSACNHVNNYMRFIKDKPLLSSTFDLNELMISVQQMFESILDKSIGLSFESDSEPCCIHGAEEHLEQVIVNLIINARDAIEHSGEIKLATKSVQYSTSKPIHLKDHTEDSFVVLTVSDSGCGMAPEVKDRIFDPFFSTKGKGTGLGLAMVRRIIERSNGVITVDSEAGRGTTFSIYFPQVLEEVTKDFATDSFVRY